jgi:hypothetical protein
MRWIALLMLAFAVALTLGACIEADVNDGVLLCSLDPNRPCPRQYYCAGDGYCYHDGHPGPAAPADMTPDLPPASAP